MKLKRFNDLRKITLILLVSMFIVTSVFILSFPYPLSTDTGKKPRSSDLWRGGTIPDEFGYFSWAQIYYETGKTYVPLEELGRTKIQHIDFYIGESPKKCLFTTVEVSKNDKSDFDWKTRSRNITVHVYNGNNDDVPGVNIEIHENRNNNIWNGISDADGTFTLSDVPPGRYSVFVDTPLNDLKLFFSTDYLDFNYPIEVSASLEKYSQSTIIITIHVDHYINANLEHVDIFHGFNQPDKPLGKTNEFGDLKIDLPVKPEMHHIVAVKETNDIIPPVGSGIVEMNGVYAVANHWPPGYCYLIIPFWISGLILFITIFLSGLVCISTYFLARRFYDEKIALLSSFMVLCCGLPLMIMYSRGLADYATMAFATVGIMLFIESIRNKNQNTGMNIFLGVSGGLFFAFAVTMRYSTIVLLLGPIVFVLFNIVKKYKLEKTKNKKSSRFTIFLPHFLKDFKRSIPFIIGLLLIGSFLASYNTTLYGGPLKSGYQTDIQVEQVGENISIETPDKTMFAKYFHPSWESLENLFSRILPQLLFLLPPLFIVPLGLFIDRKKKRSWVLFFWMIPLLIIYMQLTWVGRVPMEDMRYFLPVLPPAAILTAHTLCKIAQKDTDKNMNNYIIITIIIFIIGGFIMAYYAINWQINRQFVGPFFKPPLLAVVSISIFYVLVYGMVCVRKFFIDNERQSIK